MLNNAGFSVLNLPPLNNGFEAFFEDVKAEVQETGGSKYSASATKRFNDLIAEDSAPRCRQCRTGTGVPAFGRALRAPVQASAGLGRALRAPVPAFGRHSVPPMQANAGLRPSAGTPCLYSADHCRPCFRVPNTPSHRVHVQANAALPLPA